MGKLGFEVAVKVAEDQAQASQANAEKKLLERFKVEDTPKTIRFVTLDGVRKSVLTYAEHYVKYNNGWSRYYSCPDADNDGAPTCVLCKLRKGTDVAELSYGMKHLMQVVERNSPVLDSKYQPTRDEDGEIIKEDRLKLFKFPPGLMTTLKSYMDEYGDLGDRDYKISFIANPDTNSKLKKIYNIVPVGTKAKALSDETEELLESRVKDISELEPVYDEVAINKILNYVPKATASGVTEETKANIKKYLEDDDEEVPVTKVASKVSTDDEDEVVPVAKKKAVLDEDDDDTVDFFKLAKRNK